jgi:hypothetical protein
MTSRHPPLSSKHPRRSNKASVPSPPVPFRFFHQPKPCSQGIVARMPFRHELALGPPIRPETRKGRVILQPLPSGSTVQEL